MATDARVILDRIIRPIAPPNFNEKGLPRIVVIKALYPGTNAWVEIELDFTKADPPR